MTKYLVGVLALAALFLIQPHAAQAYIGPGVGAGAVAAVMGVLGSIFLAIVAVVYYPIKRMMKGRKSPKSSDKPAE
jgi:membrane protein implicated in regulation of membrane protease activity